MTASQKQDFTHRTLLALLCAQADKAEIENTIAALTRSLADAHGIRRSYPPAAE